jgi:multiple sugar transport system permease protein
MVASSLKDNSTIFVDAYNIFPNPLHFENYARGWQGFGGNTFLTFFVNSFIITLSVTFAAVISNPFIAYGFTRQKVRFRNFWFMTVMISMMLPGQIVMIPQYIIFQKLGWVNTFIPLILPSFFGMAFFIFLNMQFIRSIPYELDEAAKLDGCNSFGIYFKIILPLLKPAIITSAIFQFYWAWSDFMSPLIYLNNPKMFTVSVALRFFSDPSQNDYAAMFAMAALSIIPPILIFFFLQKYIVEGISTSGLKA